MVLLLCSHGRDHSGAPLRRVFQIEIKMIKHEKKTQDPLIQDGSKKKRSHKLSLELGEGWIIHDNHSMCSFLHGAASDAISVQTIHLEEM